MNIKPIGERVLVEILPESDTSAGGILLPETVRATIRTGLVIALGPGKLSDNGEYRKPDLKPGDKVLYTNELEDNKIKLEDKEYWLLNYRSVLAKIE